MNIVAQIFSHDRLEQFRDLTALQWEEGSWNYAKLYSEICRASEQWRTLGVKTDDRVVFCCADSPEFVAAYFAVLKIGAVAIAISTRYQANDIEYVLNDSDATALVCDASTSVVAESALAGRENPCALHSVQEILAPMRPVVSRGPEPTVERTTEDEALWVYSSGSTGRPKGIVHSHHNVEQCSHFHSRRLGLLPGEEIFCTSRLSFAYTLANALFVPLYLGATIYLHSDWITPAKLFSILQNRRFKALFTVPSLYRNVLDEIENSDLPARFNVRHYVSAGEHLPAEIQSGWEAATGRNIINVYGCSETLFLCFIGAMDEYPPDSVGTLMPGVDAKLVQDTKVPVPDSEKEGVLHIQHPCIFLHYANQPELTSKRLKGGVFNTGDLFRRDRNGYWYYQGREDDLLKASGQWVHLREIEDVVTASSLADEVVVVSASDVNGAVRPALFFVPSGGMHRVDAVQAMSDYLDSRLQKVQMPKWVRAMERLPRTPNGKICRHELQAMVAGTTRDAN